MIGIRQTSLHTLQQLPEALLPAWVHEREGKLDEAVHDLCVRHVFEIAEVWLGGLIHRLDELIATGRDTCRIALDFHDQAGTAGRRVVDLVKIRAQVRHAGGHAAVGLASTDPAVIVFDRHTVGGDEQVLHRLGGAGLLRSHCGRTSQDAIDGHRWNTVFH